MTSLGHWFGGGRRGGDYDPWFASEIWDPFSSGTNWGQLQGQDKNAHVDWRETEDSHIFLSFMPISQACLMGAGVRKEEVKVHVEDGNVLQISGERTKDQKEENDKWDRVERRRGSFVRRFRLPENANLDEIKCSLDHGVLTVTVPKRIVEQTPKNVRYIDVA